MEKFIITTTTERTLSEIGNARDQAAQVEHPLSILDSRNFHWLELLSQDESTRIEAIREKTEPDTHHEWLRPVRYRVIYVKRGKRTEREIERGLRGAGIFTIEICGLVLRDFSLVRVMRRKSFISFSFRVGRQTKVVLREDQGQHLKISHDRTPAV